MRLSIQLMKHLIFVTIFSGLILRLSAQEVGIRAGLDLYKFHEINSDYWDRSEKFTPSPGFGVSFRMPFKERSAFRTGLYYSSVSNKADRSQDELSQKFLKIPVQYGFTVVSEELRSGFFFGPNLGYGLRGDYLVQGTEYDLYKEQSALPRRFFFGVGAGVRGEYLGICLEVQFNFDFLGPSGVSGTEGEPVLANQIISFRLGYSYSFAEKPNRYDRRRR